jgi:hypothetical protein
MPVEIKALAVAELKNEGNVDVAELKKRWKSPRTFSSPTFAG